MFYDFTFILLIPAILLTLYAQFQVKNTYRRFSGVYSNSGRPASIVAREILDAGGLQNVRIERVAGELTDHYDPRDQVLRLSVGVYDSPSIAAYGIAAHEAGHAMQHKNKYVPLSIRSMIVPVASFGSNAAMPLFLAGLIFQFGPLMDIGIIFFSLAVVFQVVTLPVEFNASSRAMVLLGSGNYVNSVELGMVKKVLGAAALTYVAAMAVALLNLIRLVILRGSRS
jgi:hypothetical protein